MKSFVETLADCVRRSVKVPILKVDMEWSHPLIVLGID